MGSIIYYTDKDNNNYVDKENNYYIYKIINVLSKYKIFICKDGKFKQVRPYINNVKMQAHIY